MEQIEAVPDHSHLKMLDLNSAVKICPEDIVCYQSLLLDVQDQEKIKEFAARFSGDEKMKEAVANSWTVNDAFVSAQKSFSDGVKFYEKCDAFRRILFQHILCVLHFCGDGDKFMFDYYCNEYYFWDLLYVLGIFQHNLVHYKKRSETVITDEPCENSENSVKYVNLMYLKHFKLRYMQMLIDWCERCYFFEKKFCAVFDKNNKKFENFPLFTDDCRMYYQNTVSSITKNNKPFSLDPDWAHANPDTLTFQDQLSEELLYEKLFALIRSGKSVYAINLSVQHGMFWLSHIMNGWKYLRRNYNEGNIHRVLWYKAINLLLDKEKSSRLRRCEALLLSCLVNREQGLLKAGWLSDYRDVMWIGLKNLIEKFLSQPDANDVGGFLDQFFESVVAQKKVKNEKDHFQPLVMHLLVNHERNFSDDNFLMEMIRFVYDFLKETIKNNNIFISKNFSRVCNTLIMIVSVEFKDVLMQNRAYNIFKSEMLPLFKNLYSKNIQEYIRFVSLLDANLQEVYIGEILESEVMPHFFLPQNSTFQPNTNKASVLLHEIINSAGERAENLLVLHFLKNKQNAGNETQLKSFLEILFLNENTQIVGYFVYNYLLLKNLEKNEMLAYNFYFCKKIIELSRLSGHLAHCKSEFFDEQQISRIMEDFDDLRCHFLAYDDLLKVQAVSKKIAQLEVSINNNKQFELLNLEKKQLAVINDELVGFIERIVYKSDNRRWLECDQAFFNFDGEYQQEYNNLKTSIVKKYYYKLVMVALDLYRAKNRNEDVMKLIVKMSLTDFEQFGGRLKKDAKVVVEAGCEAFARHLEMDVQKK